LPWLIAKAQLVPKIGMLIKNRKLINFRISNKSLILDTKHKLRKIKLPTKIKSMHQNKSKNWTQLTLKWDHSTSEKSNQKNLSHNHQKIWTLQPRNKGKVNYRVRKMYNKSLRNKRNVRPDLAKNLIQTTKSKPSKTLFAISILNITLKMEWQAKKGRERPRESSEFYVRNLEKMWCGRAIVSNKWESSMRVNSSWLSNRSTNGGGIRPERDPERPSKSQKPPFPRPRTKRNCTTLATAPHLTTKKVKWLSHSKMNSVDTAVDSVSTLQISSRLKNKSRNSKTRKAPTSKLTFANCLTLTSIRSLFKSPWVKIHGPTESTKMM